MLDRYKFLFNFRSHQQASVAELKIVEKRGDCRVPPRGTRNDNTMRVIAMSLSARRDATIAMENQLPFSLAVFALQMQISQSTLFKLLSISLRTLRLCEKKY